MVLHALLFRLIKRPVMDHDIAALLIISYAQESTKIFSSKVYSHSCKSTKSIH